MAIQVSRRGKERGVLTEKLGDRKIRDRKMRGKYLTQRTQRNAKGRHELHEFSRTTDEHGLGER
jgi:hypothetical protein